MFHNPYKDLHTQIIATSDMIRSYYRDQPGYWKLSTDFAKENGMVKIDLNQYKDYEVAIGSGDNGDVVIDGNDTEPQTYNIDTSAFSKSGDMVFQSETDGDFTISGYIEDTDWFIVIDHKDEESLVMRYLNDTENMTFLIGSLIIFTTVAILVFIMFGRYMSGFGAYKGVEGNYDKLTGLPNRNYFKDIYGERGVLNTTIYKSMAVFDIDYFKEANDTMNGDEILINTITMYAHRIQ
jgi:predicted signal transduction protein with EAL and GGDEF domain